MNSDHLHYDEAITQEQAEWMQERLKDMGELSGKFGFGGWGRRGGCVHGIGGDRRWNPQPSQPKG